MINRMILHRAAKIYHDMFFDNIGIDEDMASDLCRVCNAAEFESFRERLSAGQFDAIEFAVMEE